MEIDEAKMRKVVSDATFPTDKGIYYSYDSIYEFIRETVENKK